MIKSYFNTKNVFLISLLIKYTETQTTQLRHQSLGDFTGVQNNNLMGEGMLRTGADREKSFWKATLRVFNVFEPFSHICIENFYCVLGNVTVFLPKHLLNKKRKK